MSSGASQIVAQLNKLFDAGYKAIQALDNAGVKYDKEAILCYDSRTLEFRYSLNIKMNTSSPRRFARKFKSKLATELVIPSNGQVYAIPHGEISPYVNDRGDEKSIDISAMLIGLPSSNDVFIIFNEDLSDEQTKALFPIPHAIRDPNYTDGYKKAEIAIKMNCLRPLLAQAV